MLPGSDRLADPKIRMRDHGPKPYESVLSKGKHRRSQLDSKPLGLPSADGAWPRGQSSCGSQRDCGQAKSQNTTVESEFIMNSSNSSNFAKRNSRPVKPTSPLSAEMASAVRSPSSASLIAAK